MSGWSHSLGEDPTTWGPMFVDWSSLTPETNEDHALFLAKFYVDNGLFDPDTKKMVGPPEWLCRAVGALQSAGKLKKFEEELRSKNSEAAERLYCGEE